MGSPVEEGGTSVLGGPEWQRRGCLCSVNGLDVPIMGGGEVGGYTRERDIRQDQNSGAKKRTVGDTKKTGPNKGLTKNR